MLIFQESAQKQKISNLDKKVKNPSLDYASRLFSSQRPHYEKLLNRLSEGDGPEIPYLSTLKDYALKMLEAGQTPASLLYWADQFMHQKSKFLAKEDPLMVKLNLNANEMIAITRAAYNTTQIKENLPKNEQFKNIKTYGDYFKARAKGYEGGLVNYFLTSLKSGVSKWKGGNAAGLTNTDANFKRFKLISDFAGEEFRIILGNNGKALAQKIKETSL